MSEKHRPFRSKLNLQGRREMAQWSRSIDWRPMSARKVIAFRLLDHMAARLKRKLISVRSYMRPRNAALAIKDRP